MIMPTRSYLSQVELPVTFGLGPVSDIDRLTVIWPNGDRQVLSGFHIDTELNVAKVE
jgi:hypothetical protein